MPLHFYYGTSSRIRPHHRILGRLSPPLMLRRQEISSNMKKIAKMQTIAQMIIRTAAIMKFTISPPSPSFGSRNDTSNRRSATTAKTMTIQIRICSNQARPKHMALIPYLPPGTHSAATRVAGSVCVGAGVATKPDIRTPSYIGAADTAGIPGPCGSQLIRHSRFANTRRTSAIEEDRWSTPYEQLYLRPIVGIRMIADANNLSFIWLSLASQFSNTTTEGDDARKRTVIGTSRGRQPATP